MGKEIYNPKSELRVFDQLTTSSKENDWFYNFFNDNTQQTYQIAIKQFGTFLGLKNKEELRLVTGTHIIAFRDYLISKSYSAKTIATKMSALSSLFDAMIEDQLIKHNPVKGIKRPAQEYSTVKASYVDSVSAKAMRSGPDESTLIGLRNATIFYTLFGTGCRVSELCHLKVKDFFQEQSVEGQFYILDFQTKGGKRKKTAIAQVLTNKIQSYLDQSGHADNEEAPLFLSMGRRLKPDEQKHLSRDVVSDIWNKYRTGKSTQFPLKLLHLITFYLTANAV